MLAMNTSVSRITQKTAYELVFGQLPRHNQEFWDNIHQQIRIRSSNDGTIINEDEIDCLFGEENYFDSMVVYPFLYCL